jgi:hypothetical protein
VDGMLKSAGLELVFVVDDNHRRLFVIVMHEPGQWICLLVR